MLLGRLDSRPDSCRDSDLDGVCAELEYPGSRPPAPARDPDPDPSSLRCSSRSLGSPSVLPFRTSRLSLSRLVDPLRLRLAGLSEPLLRSRRSPPPPLSAWGADRLNWPVIGSSDSVDRCLRPPTIGSSDSFDRCLRPPTIAIGRGAPWWAAVVPALAALFVEPGLDRVAAVPTGASTVPPDPSESRLLASAVPRGVGGQRVVSIQPARHQR